MGQSKAVHAVSDKLTGPYIDKGLCWPGDEEGKGHNVTALVLPGGRYAVVISATRPATVYVSKSLDGPWERLGEIQVAANEFTKKGQNGVTGRLANVSIMVRPDGDFQFVDKRCANYISKVGILGPYICQAKSAYAECAGFPQEKMEDPVLWYSGGLYHIVVNGWDIRKAYHITSVDGIKDWKLQGLAYDPRKDFIRYTDGTINHWYKLERPGVLIENGHVTAVTLAVVDVDKKKLKDGNHGSKVIVIPFDGAAMDRDLQNASAPKPKP